MRNKRYVRWLILAILLFTALNVAVGQLSGPMGDIQGIVLDADTQSPLVGTNIRVLGTVKGAASGLDGSFVIRSLPVGSYVLEFDFIGYQKLRQTDVIVRPKRATFVSAQLKMTVLEASEVSVTAGYFAQTDDQVTSAVNFGYEEIRRAPGSAGDISRIITSLPSVAKVNDQTNNLVVRGGSPVENAFFIDNIEIPNINHFPTQGATGGPLGLINVDLIQDANFYTGGFSALYGDRLSSILAIEFREGNRKEFDGQLDLNFAGFGGVAEGPLARGKGSWLASVRRSYLDLLADVVEIGSTAPPYYGDAQVKLVYDLNPNHRLSVLCIQGDDHNNPDRKTAQESDMIYFGNQDIYETTIGANWRALWSQNGYSNTSIALTRSNFKEDFYETNSGMQLIRNRSLEQDLKLRNSNHFRLHKHSLVELGFEAKMLIHDYDNLYAEYTDALGNSTPALTMTGRVIATKLGAFVNYNWQPLKRLTTVLGLRTDYLNYNKNHSLAPRLGLAYQLSHRTSVNGAVGWFYQNLPLLLLQQNPAHRSLADPQARHYVLGLSHLVTENTRFSLEVYQKDYAHFPLDPNQPTMFMLDEIYYRYGFFFGHEQLRANGKARARGVEMMLQKKLARNFYGLASACYFKTRYQGGDGQWRDRVFDNRFIFGLEGGYKPNNRWEFSLRWIYAGGVPFTPFNPEKSRELKRAVLAEERVNTERYPDYHSLNLRLDRRFHFMQSNIVCYFSVWNAYDRKNVASYFWNQQDNRQDTIYQWRLLPIFGIEYEF